MTDQEYPVDHVDLDDLLIHQLLPQTRVSRTLDGIIMRLGSAVSWCWILLLLIVVINVVMRKVFAQGRIEFEEVQWHIYSAGFLFGLSYTYVADDHVRVDVLRERMKPVTQAWIELYGTLLLLLPFLLLIIVYATPFVYYSFQLSEISEAPGGLPYRWAVKALLPIGFLFLLAATISRLSRLTSFLFGWPAALVSLGGSAAIATDRSPETRV